MRLFEILLVAMLSGGGVCLLIGRWRQNGRRLIVGALVAAVFHGILEGVRWQMIPAYLAIGILGLAWWEPFRGKLRTQRFMSWSTLLLASASVLFSLLLPIFRLPAPTGPYSVGTSILYLKDPSRIEDAAPDGASPRELMVQLWYPAQPSQNRFARYREARETGIFSFYQSILPTNSRLDAPVVAAGAPFPVILFNPAWSGRRTNDTFLTEELASHGYVVASIDHTYNAKLVAFPDGRVVYGIAASDIDAPESSSAERVRAIWGKELKKWVADQRFVLDRLDAMNRADNSRWFGRLEINQAGAIGHSFGGAAATALCAEDRRVVAAVNMDGWFFGAIRERAANQPLLFMDAYTVQVGATSDPNARVEAALDARDFADVEDSLHKFGGYMVSVKGASHEDFTDQPLVSPLRMLSHRGALPAQRIQKIVRGYVVAFFDKTLRGEDPEILRAQSSPYVEVSLATWPASKGGLVSSAGSDGQ